MRRRWIPLALASLALAATVPGLLPRASVADDVVKKPLIDDDTRRSIEQGLRFLARTQHENGAWISDAGNKVNDEYRVPEGQRDKPNVGVTALGILAFLAAGHVPGRGPYGVHLDRAVRFLMANVRSDGFITAHETRMYEHAFATLALAEVFGTTRAAELRKKLESAVELTIKCQNSTGGWRYVPFTIESDMSVTVCQVVALRAARNVGIRVPQETIDAALRYVIDSAITDPFQQPTEVGAFLYQPSNTRWNRSSFSLTAAGLTTLFQAGIYDDTQLEAYTRSRGIRKVPSLHIRDTVTYMDRAYAGVPKNHFFYYYGNYYAAQAMYNWGGTNPEVWERWYRRVRADLLSVRRDSVAPGGAPGGAPGVRESRWESNIGTTDTFATAVAILILSIPFDYLPIHQK